MKQLLCLLAALAGIGLGALDFPDYDAGKGLPDDQPYPQGRIFPIAGFQGASLKKLSEDGFTVAGPGYGANVARLHKQTKELQIPAFFQISAVQDGKTVTMKSFNDKAFTPDWKQIEASFAEQIRKADREYPTIVYWYIMPEELRWWKKKEMKYLELFHKAVQENDPKKRPVWMYIPNHYGPSAYPKYLPYLDIIGKGMYVNYSGNRNTRNWVRWSSEGQAEAVKNAKGKFAICVPELFQNPPEGEEEKIPAWVRHDVYLSLACGSKGVVIFSLSHRPSLKKEIHARYYAAYIEVAKELTGKDGLGQVYLFGKVCQDIKGEALGAEKLTAKTGAKTYESPAVKMSEHLYRGARYLTIVNSAEKPVAFQVSGIPAGLQMRDCLTGEKIFSLEFELKPLEVKIIKVFPGAKKK